MKPAAREDAPSSHETLGAAQDSAAPDIDSLDAALINRLQAGIDVCAAPFRPIAAELGLDESGVLRRLERLLTEGVLSRFGPMVDVEALGGVFTLVAAEVPEDRFDEVAARVNAHPEIAHNYRRAHRLNLWFVSATETSEQSETFLDALETEIALPLVRLPKLEEYHLGLHLDARPPGAGPRRGAALRAPRAAHGAKSQQPLDALERRIVEAAQAGLPLAPDPFAELAQRLEWPAELVRARCAALLARGVFRRIAAVPNHYRLGYRANGMSVWDVDDARVSGLGHRVGALDCVSHCYRRPRRGAIWPYNLFAMLHARTRDEIETQRGEIRRLLGDACRADDVLYSTAILKKTGFRLSLAGAEGL